MLFFLAALIGAAGVALWFLDSSQRRRATDTELEPAQAQAPVGQVQNAQESTETAGAPEAAAEVEPAEPYSDDEPEAEVVGSTDQGFDLPPGLDENYESRVFDVASGHWASLSNGGDEVILPEEKPVTPEAVELVELPEVQAEDRAEQEDEPEGAEEFYEGEDLTPPRPEPGTVFFEVEEAEPTQAKSPLSVLPGATRREKRSWAHERGFDYQRTDDFLTDEWSRGAASTGAAARDVVSGIVNGHEMHLAELGGITVMALRRPQASDVVLDARRARLEESAESDDLIPVTSVADFQILSNDQGAAERMMDERFRQALENMPDTVTAVWMESDWVLAQTAKGSTHQDWDHMTGLLAVIAIAARVLPPRMGATQAVDFSDCDPSRPMPVPPSYFEDEADEDLPDMPQIARQEEPIPLPTRAQGESHGVVEPRSIGAQPVEAIAGGEQPASTSFQGTRIVRDLDGRSSIFDDGPADPAE